MSASAASQRKNSASRPSFNTARSSLVGARSRTVPSERGWKRTGGCFALGSEVTKGRRLARAQ